MESYLPQAKIAAQAQAHRGARQSKLAVHSEGEVYPIAELTVKGFAIHVGRAPPLRGLIEIHNGATPLFTCLIVHSAIDGDYRRFEFKRQTPHRLTPPRDYAEERETAGYLTR